MKTLVKLIIPAIALMAVSCHKDKSPAPEETAPVSSSAPASAFGFKKGNWWVYTCVSTGTAIQAPYSRDSVYIDRDSVVRAKTFVYFQSVRTPYTSVYLFPFTNMWVTDSADFIIDISGKKLYSCANFTGDIRKDTSYWGPIWAYAYRFYELPGTTTVTCNSNTYNVYVNIFEVTPNPVNYPNSPTRKYNHMFNLQQGFIKYEDGLLNDTIDVFENKLLNYFVQ